MTRYLPPEWRKRLSPASFRGVPFHWLKLDTEIGRRVARHDYPQRDDAYLEDLGKLPRKFTIDAFVLGSDYMTGRDKLMDALESAGSGPLVHPTFGAVNVQLVPPVVVSETTAEGGMARFTLTFLTVAGAVQPIARPDTRAAVAAKADQVKTAVAADAVKGVVAQSTAAGLVTRFLNAAGQLLTKVNAVRSRIAGVMDTVMRVKSMVNAIVAIPAMLIQTVQGVITSLALMAKSPLPSLSLYAGLFGSSGSTDGDVPQQTAKIAALKTFVATLADFGSDLPLLPVATPRQRAAARTQAALVALVRVTAIAEAAELAADIDYPTFEDCVTVRDLVAGKIDDMLEGDAFPVSDALYAALSELRTAVIADAEARGADLSRQSSYTPRVTLPALVIAHRLYQDATRADDILVRNRVRHPGFVTGGQALEVLIDP